MRGTGSDRTAILRRRETQWCRRRPHGVGARAPNRPMQVPQEFVSGGEFCVHLQTVVSVYE